jgi:hypothetical protein
VVDGRLEVVGGRLKMGDWRLDVGGVTVGDAVWQAKQG